jgi:SAM-dependent methyltransferase
MGRFASTVSLYARYREPYPPAFFSTVAERLALRRDMRLLDAGCGPGLLAIGFAPYVGACVGVDPEPGMIPAARAAANHAGVQLQLIEGRLEDLPENLGNFDLVTIGRALHWMDPEATLRVLDRVLAEGGALVTCGARPLKGEANPWLEAYDDARKAWALDRDERRYRIDHGACFAGSRFRVAEEITVRHRHRVTIADLISRALSKSNTSPEVLGNRQEAFEASLARVLEPFAADGSIDEEIVAVATVLTSQQRIQAP